MHATICPTVTARTTEEYHQQMERLAGFATRVHIDIADGVFAHVKLTSIKDIWWPSGVQADIHVMYKDPLRHMEELLELQPQLIVVHAEADGNFKEFVSMLRVRRIKVGVALKPETPIDLIREALNSIDHVLVFSGHLGHFGGKANTHLLTKVLHLKHLKPGLEVGWDGGINDKNAPVLVAGGVDVLNTGGYIQHADDPHAAYERLQQAIQNVRRHKS